MIAASMRRCISETIEKGSSASSFDICQWTLGACAVVLRNMLKVPLTKLQNPRFSLFSLSLARVLIAHRLVTAKGPIGKDCPIIRQIGTLLDFFRRRFSRPRARHENSYLRAIPPGKSAERPGERRGWSDPTAIHARAVLLVKGSRPPRRTPKRRRLQQPGRRTPRPGLRLSLIGSKHSASRANAQASSPFG